MIKKADIFILVLLFLIILSVFTAVTLKNDVSSQRYVNIYSDGELKYSIPLSDSLKKEIIVDNFGYNKIVIENNSVKVTDSDCKGRDCIKFGAVKKAGDVIICAPHKLAVRIESKEGLDAVSY